MDLTPLRTAIGSAVHGYGVALWRNAENLAWSVATADGVWGAIADHGRAKGRALVDLRAHAAMAAVARWHLHAAIARTESRGLHVREDAPQTDRQQATRLLVGGLGTIWTRPEARTVEGVAA